MKFDGPDHELLDGGRAQQRRQVEGVQLPVALVGVATPARRRAVPAHRVGERDAEQVVVLDRQRPAHRIR